MKGGVVQRAAYTERQAGYSRDAEGSGQIERPLRQIDGALAVQFKFRRGAARIGHGNNALVTGERDQNLFKSSTGRGQLFNFFKALRSTAQKSGQPFEVLCDGRKIRQFKLQRRDGDAALSVQGSGDIGSVEPQPGVDASLSGNLSGRNASSLGSASIS